MELENPLLRAEGDSYEDGSEAASKLGTVRMVDGMLAFPLVVRFVRLLLDSVDVPLVLLFIVLGRSGDSVVFCSTSDAAELEGGDSVEKSFISFCR